MANGYTRSPKLLKGALVEFSSRFIGPVPNIIIFQYNPEKLSRSLQPWQPPPIESGEGEESEEQTPQVSGITLAQPFDPSETFTLSLELDATDALEMPERHPVAVVSGVADRIAAMEMLLYPDREGGGLGELVGSIGDALSGGGGEEEEPRYSVPIVLFVWGPGRILPVRLTSFSVDEEAFSTILYPIRAKVSIGLRVVSPAELERHPDTTARDIAAFAYKFTVGQKEVLAMANLANTVESILGILPF
jgi:hypothetical protein